MPMTMIAMMMIAQLLQLACLHGQGVGVPRSGRLVHIAVQVLADLSRGCSLADRHVLQCNCWGRGWAVGHEEGGSFCSCW